MSKFSTKLRKASPLILTCLSIAGVVGTVILSIKNTPKAASVIEEKKEELGVEELEPAEIVRTTWKYYIPTALVGIGTIGCIIGIGVLDRRNQAILASAYGMLNESYKQYRQASKKVYGDDAENRINAEMAKDAMVATSDWGYQVYNMKMDPDSEKMLFYDSASRKYFTTTMAAVLNAQYHVNRNIAIKGECSLNEYLSFLGVDNVENGDDFAWDIDHLAENECCWLDFDNQKTTLEDGMECVVINTFELNDIC